MGLLERENALGALTEHLDEAALGSGGALLVCGTAGTGRTSLLAEAAERARQRALRVASVRASSLETSLDGEVMLQLLGALGAQPGGREALLGAVGRRPTVVIVDDVQFADVASLTQLTYTARRAGSAPLAMLLGVREGDIPSDPEVLDELATDSATHTLRLDPLTPRAVAELAREATGAEVPAAAVSVLQTLSGGIPALVCAILDALGGRPIALPADVEQAAELAAQVLGRGQARAISRLPGDASAVAGALAVLATPAPLEIVAAVADLPLGAVRIACTQLTVSGYGVLEGDEAQLSPPLLARAISTTLPPESSRDAHARAARALRASGAPIAEVGDHILEGGLDGELWTTGALRAAAERALADGSGPRAVALLRSALRSVPRAERGTVLGELGAAEAAVHSPAAENRLRAAIEETDDPMNQAELGLTLGRALLVSDKRIGALDAWWAAQRAAEAAGSWALQSRLLGDIFSVLRSESSMRGLASDRVEHLTALAREHGDEGAPLLAHLSDHAARTGRPADEAIELAQRAVESPRLAEEADSVAIFFAVNTLAVADRLDHALAIYDDLVARRQREASPFGLAAARCFRAWVRLLRGELAAAESDSAAALELALAHGLEFGRAYPIGYLCRARLWQGDFAGAAAPLLDANLDHELPESFHISEMLYSRGLLRLAQNRPTEALRDMRECGQALEATGVRNPGGVPWRGCAAVCLRQLGDADRAQRIAREELEDARAWGAPRTVAQGLRYVALGEPPDVAAQLLDESLALLDTVPAARFDHALNRVAMGLTLARLDDREGAREHLGAGLEYAERCGAAPLAAFAREGLVAAGARPRRAARSGADALTARERDVAVLAAQGLSNREIADRLVLSQKTITRHLGAVYRKLDIASRMQLSDALAD